MNNKLKSISKLLAVLLGFFFVSQVQAQTPLSYWYAVDINNQPVHFLQSQTVSFVVCTGANLTGSQAYPSRLILTTDGNPRQNANTEFSFYAGTTPQAFDVTAVIDSDLSSILPSQGIKKIVAVNPVGGSYPLDPNDLSICSNGGNSGCCASCQFPQAVTIGGKN